MIFQKIKPLFLKIKNIKLYSIILVIGFVMLVISNFFNYGFLDIVENIVYSIIAATIMAFFIDYTNLKRNLEFQKIYFEEINRKLSILIGRFLWFEEHLNDDKIDWEWDTIKFTKKEFSFYMNDHSQSYFLTFDEAKDKLKEIGNQYSSDSIKRNPDEYLKVKKLFQIFAYESESLVFELKRFNRDILLLDVNGLMDYEEFSKLKVSVLLAINFLHEKDDVNLHYGGPIKILIDAMEKFRKLGNYNKKIEITINSLVVDINEL